MSKVIVVGGGPAGMFTAIAAAGRGHGRLLEKNEKLGKKLYITGKGHSQHKMRMDCLPMLMNRSFYTTL